MAKIQMPLVGGEVSTKELLILIVGIGLLGWWVKRGLVKSVGKVVDSVKPVFSSPGSALYDFIHPEIDREDPEISISDQIDINKEVLAAQEGAYTHRPDGLH